VVSATSHNYSCNAAILMLTEARSLVSAAIYIGQNLLMSHVHDWSVLLSTHIL